MHIQGLLAESSMFIVIILIFITQGSQGKQQHTIRVTILRKELPQIQATGY